MVVRVVAGAALFVCCLAAPAEAQQGRDTGVRRAPPQGAQAPQTYDNGIRRAPQPDADFGVRRTPSSEHLITLRPGMMQQLQFELPFTTVFVGDPNVVEPVANSNKSLSIRAKTPGTTNLSVINDVGEEMYSVSLQVAEVRPGGRVIVHAKKDSVHDVFAYQCSPTGCDRVEHRFDIPSATPPIVIGAPAPPPTVNVIQSQGQQQSAPTVVPRR